MWRIGHIMRFDIETLRLFIFVIEGGSISAASERGNVVVSAVSRRISDLERAAGTPLLHRRSRGVEPTPAGVALYRRAKIGMVQKARILVNSRRAESSPAYKVCGPAFVL